MKKKLVIIGAGPAGLAAAHAAYNAGLAASDIMLLERDVEAGGILNQCIHAGFGLHRFGEELTGPEYAHRFIEMVEKDGIETVLNAMVLSLTSDKKVTFISPELGYTTVEAEAVILAMGCRERTRGALSIPGTRPSGVFTAGSAQRFMNIEGYLPGKEVVILGSGDIGLIMARRMTLEGAHVRAVCELMPYSGGLSRNIVQCLDDFGIPLKLSHTVCEIHGKERLEGVTIAAVDENNGRRIIPETKEYIPCDTLLLSCGLIPENELTREADIAIDRVTNGAYVNQYRETLAPGIFSCGNVLHVHDLVDYVSEEAETAGKAAAELILGRKRETLYKLSVSVSNGVRYTVPERIDLSDSKEPVRIFFRVGNVYKNVELTVSSDKGDLILKKFKRTVAPGEMESLQIPSETLCELARKGAEGITVYLTEKEGK